MKKEKEKGEERVRQDLLAMEDKAYKAFQEKLIPTVNPKNIIGIRTPLLRKYARAFARTTEADRFLETLPHGYYEENNLHAFVIETIKDYEKAMRETEKFLPFIDNWATCDSFLPPVFRKHPQEVYEKAVQFIHSDHPYTVRYGIGIFMKNYLDEQFREEIPALVAGLHAEEYYVNMMCAWYMATALAKQEKTILPYLEENRLPVWVHNKTIQKSIESRRISPEMKRYLKTLRRK